MIRVEVNKKNNVIESIHCIGHAGYADYGKDIVCSSFSTMRITTINAILEIDKDAISYTDTNNFKRDYYHIINNCLEKKYLSKLFDRTK